MACGDFKNSNRRTFGDKVLHDKAFNIVKDPKYDGYQRSLASMVFKFFGKKTSGRDIKSENISNKELAKKLVRLRTKWFESSCSHLNFRLCTCFEQRVP